MIKSIATAYSARKFVAYSHLHSDLLQSLRYLNNVYATFSNSVKPTPEKTLKKAEILPQEYEGIVNKQFSFLPEEKQAKIVKELNSYRENGEYKGKKPSYVFHEAYMKVIGTLPEPDEGVSRLGLPQFDNTHDRSYVEREARRPK
jgi:hypothetical protein